MRVPPGKVLSRHWPDVRAAWRDGVLCLVAGPSDRDALADALLAVADQASWTLYGRGWADAQKASTKAKSAVKLAIWQAESQQAGLALEPPARLHPVKIAIDIELQQSRRMIT